MNAGNFPAFFFDFYLLIISMKKYSDFFMPI